MSATTRKTKQEVVAEFRTAEILTAARKVFAEKGFNEATVDQIAEEAGVAKGTVYLYFPSKRDIYLAALKHGIRGALEVSQQKVEAASTLAAKIHAYVETKLRYVVANLDFFRIYHAEFGKTHPRMISEELAELHQRQLDVLIQMLRQGIESGEARELSVELVAWGVSEMTRGVALRRVMGVVEGPVEDDIEELSFLLWNGIRAQ